MWHNIAYFIIGISLFFVLPKLTDKAEKLNIYSGKRNLFGLVSLGFILIGLNCFNLPDGANIALLISYAFEYTAACMDQAYKEVYVFLHICAFVPLFILYVATPIPLYVWGAALLFAALAFGFSLFYGLSDSFAFAVQGMITTFVLYNNNSSANIYYLLLYELVGMFITYSIFFAVQLLKRNVNRKGNCKEPKAFIPYIYSVDVLILFVVKYVKL